MAVSGHKLADLAETRLPNAQWLTGRNQTDSGDVNLWRVNTSNRLETAAALDLTGTVTHGINFSGTYTNYAMDLGSATYPSGAMRIKNNSFIVARNAGGSGDVPIVGLNGSDEVNLGGASNPINIVAGQTLRFSDSTATKIQFGTTNGTQIGTGTTQKLAFWNATPTTQPVNTSNVRAALVSAGLIASGGGWASAGDLRMRNDQWLAARNAADGADVNMLRVNTSNLIELGASVTDIKLRAGLVYDIRAYGAAVDNSTDDTAAIQAAAAAAAANVGGGVVWIPGRCVVNGTLDFTDFENVTLAGPTNVIHPYLASLADRGAVLRRASGTGILLDWSASASATNGLKGNRIENVSFDGNATTVVRLRSHYGGVFRGIGIRGGSSTTTGLVLNTVDHTGVEDLQQCTFDQISVNVSAASTAKAITMGSYARGGGNVSANNFTRIMVYTANGTGIELGDADTNTFIGVLCNRSGTAIGIDLLGEATGAGGGHARYNHFYHVDAVGGLTARNNTTPSGPNYLHTSKGNSTPLPTVETGALLTFDSTTGEFSMQREQFGTGTFGIRFSGSYSSYAIDTATMTGAGVPIRLPNNKAIYGRNNANSADVQMLYVNTSDEVQLGTTMRTAGIIVGGGSNITLSSGATGTKLGTNSTEKLGFWGATAIVRPSAFTQTYSTADKTHANFTSSDLTGITSSTTGSALAEPSAAYTQSEMQQNFRRIQDQFVLLRADVADLKQLANSMIDDLQSMGLFA